MGDRGRGLSRSYSIVSGSVSRPLLSQAFGHATHIAVASLSLSFITLLHTTSRGPPTPLKLYRVLSAEDSEGAIRGFGEELP